MMFPRLNYEEVVQVDDKTRLDASPSFVEAETSAITLLRIEPEGGAGFVDVTSTKKLDWQYSTDGAKTVTVEVTTDGAPVTKTFDLEVLTATDDKLLSDDNDLRVHEPDILNWVRKGRATFLDYHRRAQTLILQWLDRAGYTNINNERYTKADILDIEEFNEWSTMLVLRLIFEGISNSTNDVFAVKSATYRSKELKARDRVTLKIDLNSDGTLDEYEKIENFGSVRLDKF